MELWRNVFKNFENLLINLSPLFNYSGLYLNLSDFFIQNNSHILDIGCSTGNFINSIRERHANNEKKIKYLGIDNTKEMINFCKKRYEENLSFLYKILKILTSKMQYYIFILYNTVYLPKKRQKLIDKIFIL